MHIRMYCIIYLEDMTLKNVFLEVSIAASLKVTGDNRLICFWVLA